MKYFFKKLILELVIIQEHSILNKAIVVMKKAIINFIALIVIGLGAYHLSGVQNAKAATGQAALAATCTCEGGDNCTGDKCECNSDGTCNSCDNSLLGIIQCDLE